MKIAVDFDGTVVEHVFPEVGQDVPYAIDTLKYLVSTGHKIILNTMRSEKHLQHAVDWFNKNEIELFGVGVDPSQNKWTTSNKCYANLYIDDMAFGCPTIQPPGFSSPVVDWQEVRLYFEGLEND